MGKYWMFCRNLLVLMWVILALNWSDPVDVLRVLELSENMEGVSLKAGLCSSRRGTEETDLAFKIDKKIQLSAPTKQLFPGTGFLFKLDSKLKKGSQFFLLSVYDDQGVQQLGIEVGRSPVFLYEDQHGKPTPEMYPIFKKINLADGKWHRIAYSVQDKSVTMYLDCQRVESLKLLRGDNAVVSTEGVTVFGTRLLDEAVFEVGHHYIKSGNLVPFFLCLLRRSTTQPHRFTTQPEQTHPMGHGLFYVIYYLYEMLFKCFSLVVNICFQMLFHRTDFVVRFLSLFYLQRL
uniref:Thrombospondin-like N-terminal domain-containing protein n=1 Tax=Labrus bergylta TaxID=56723 RepID=A0A3Q3G9M8_9LABR